MIAPAAHADEAFHRLVLEYDGTDFAGWQVQPSGRTVQGEVESALRRLARGPVRVTGAGRTDAGVHALGQVASFRADVRLHPDALRRALNALLPRDVRVREAERLDRAFDARRDARARSYRYRVARRPLAVGRQYAWYPRGPFSLGLMREASECLAGVHRWSAFCRHDPEETRYESEVRRVEWTEEGDAAVFEITAVRFFHNMVRILVGSLLEVGRGRWAPGRMGEILRSGDRRLAGPTAPPQGLFLTNVEY